MLHLDPVPSRLRWLLALASHGLALLAVYHCGAPLWLKPFLALLAVASLWREFVDWRGRGESVALRLGRGSVALELDGTTVSVPPPRLLHCSEWLVVLEFSLRGPETGRRRLRLCLFPDSLETDDLRRLRRWLRYDSG